MNYKVLVVIVTHNAVRWIRQCLWSVLHSNYPCDIFVLDSDSSDGTLKIMQNEFPGIARLCYRSNVGFGAANNKGFETALDKGYDFVYLLNQDAWLEPDTIGTLLAAWTPEYGVLSPVQKAASGRLDANFAHKCAKSLKAAAAKKLPLTAPVEVPFVMAAHWLVSREAIATVGGFSPLFTHMGEDDNWIDRLHHFGLRCGVVPAAIAVHDRETRPEDKERRMRRKCVAPVVKLANPSCNFCLRAVLEPLELVAMGLKNFSAMPFRQIVPLLRRYPEIRAAREKSLGKGAFLHPMTHIDTD